MAIKFEELIKKIPQQGALKSGKEIAPKDRNVYENLAQLYTILKKLQGEIGGKGKEPSVDNLMENIKGLTAAMCKETDRKTSATDEQIRKGREAYDQGFIDEDIIHLDSVIDDLPGAAAETKKTVKEQLQRVGAGIGMEGTFIDQQYRNDDAEVVRKIQNPEPVIAAPAPKAEPKAVNPVQEALTNDLNELYPENEGKTALSIIDESKRKINGQLFLNMEPRDRQKLVASILTARNCVESDPGKIDKLRDQVNKNQFSLLYKNLMEHDAFQSFMSTLSPEQIQETFKGRGHGGNIEKMFREHVKNMDVLPEKLPERFMPTMAERTELLKGKIKDKLAQGADPHSPEMRKLYAEIFACRMCVGSGRNDKTALKARVDGTEVHRLANELLEDPTFNSFIDEKGAEVAALANKRGHGGAMEDKYRAFVSGLNKIPETIPNRYMPTAMQRTESLIKQMKSPSFQVQTKEYKKEIAKELFAARDAVGAYRNRPSILENRLNKESLRESYDNFNKSKTFNNFLDTYVETKAFHDAITAGHGGACVQEFEGYLNDMEIAPKDVPERYISAALRDRTNYYEQNHANDAKDPTERNKELNEIMKQKTSQKSWTKGQLKHFAAELMYVNQVKVESKGDEDVWGPKMETEQKKQGIQDYLSSAAMEKMFANKSIEEMQQMVAKGPSSLTTQFYNAKQNLDKENELDIENFNIGNIMNEKEEIGELEKENKGPNEEHIMQNNL